MSFSDDAFDEFDLDESTIAHIDAVENGAAAAASKAATEETARILCPETPDVPLRTSRTALSRPPPHNTMPSRPPAEPSRGPSDPIEIDADEDWDDGLLGQLDVAEQAAAAAGCTTIAARSKDGNIGNAVAGPSRGMQRTASSGANYVQRTLFGDRATQAPPSNGLGIVTMSSQSVAGGGTKKARQTKQWNRTAYAQSGARRITAPRPRPTQQNSEDRALEAALAGVEDIEDDEDFECPPPRARPPLPAAPPPDAMKLELDVQAAETFLYPTNMAKRDYQFNIVQRALFDNVLVALPTGLGKTFIAAVVILNFFRWYPKGKIVFVAPTKPLVAQQQMACHGICGLPWDVACEMTGNTAKSRRGNEWEEKRIFYMTPQTLDNDLATGDVDPKDIVCLVVDEAHRATGNYAYCNIVSQMQAVNPYFRILALTATPGSTSERVQEVIDNLHISLIELRTEEALDIRQYIHKKREEPIVVSMTDDFRHLRDLYLDVMDENCNTLVTHGLLPRCDAATLHPFRVRSIYAERKSILAQKRWLGSTINETAKMADARHHLDTFSIKMFRARIQELLDSMKKQDSKKMKLAQVINLAASMPDEAHPKMIKCVDVILDHFSRETQDSSTRVMVFCSLREAVHEIVDLLNQQEGVKATPFIGQASDKRGRGLTQKEQQEIIQKFKQGTYNVIVATSIGEEGLDIGEVDLIVCYEAVKDSVRMLQRVGRTGRKREGRIVVLMTEGPESSVWQKSKDTYKGVQQTITAGHSVTLFDDVPRLVPQSIKPTAHFEELDQPEFEPAMISSKKAAGKSAKALEKAKKRRARLTDVDRNVPEGALLGFLKASAISRDLQEADDDEEGDRGGAARRAGTSMRRRGQQAREALNSVYSDSDDDDDAMERGLDFKRPDLSRTTSAQKKKKQAEEEAAYRQAAEQSGAQLPTASKPITISSTDSRGETTNSARRGRQLGARRATSQHTGSADDGRRSRFAVDSDDEAGGSEPASSPLPLIFNRANQVNGASAAMKKAQPAQSAASGASGSNRSASKPASDPSPASAAQRRAASSFHQSPSNGEDDFSMSWANDDGVLAQLSQEATRQVQARQPSAARKDSQQKKGSINNTAPSALQDSPSPEIARRRSGKVHPLMASLLAEQERQTAAASPSNQEEGPSSRSKPSTASIADDSSPIVQRRAPRVPQPSHESVDESPLVDRRRKRVTAVSDSPLGEDDEARGLMGPPRSKPASRFRRAVAPSSDGEEDGERSRARGGANGKGKGKARDKDARTVNIVEDSSEEDRPDAAANGKRKASATSKNKKSREKKKRITNSPTSRAFFHHEAERDTDEERRERNRSDSNDEGLSTDEADTSDLEHVGDFEPTQAPRGYKQMDVYRQSLLTQGGGDGRVESYAALGRRAGRRGAPLGRGGGGGPAASFASTHRGPQPRIGRSSQGDESDRYSLGSFVCDDDDVDYESGSGANEDSDIGADDDPDVHWIPGVSKPNVELASEDEVDYDSDCHDLS